MGRGKVFFEMRFVGDHRERRARLALEDLKRRQLSLFEQDNSKVTDPYYGPYQNVPGLVRDLEADKNNTRGRSSIESVPVSIRKDRCNSTAAAPLSNNRARQSQSGVGTRARQRTARAKFSKCNPW